jgi:hypothetical protein
MSAANGEQQSLLGSLWSLGGSMYQYATEQMNKYVGNISGTAKQGHLGFITFTLR